MNRNCLTCNKIIKARGKRRLTAKYCSFKCRGVSMIGHTPWNKGLHIRLNTGRTHFKKGEVANENNWLWKGERVSYSGLHHWLKRKLGKPCECVFCGENERKIAWANVSHEYKRDLSDYISLCYSCHKNYDLGNISI